MRISFGRFLFFLCCRKCLLSFQVKHLINKKNAAYRNYFKNNKSSQSFAMFQSFQSELSIDCHFEKQILFKGIQKLLDPSTSPKTYWSILKTLLDNKKIPIILTIFHEKKFIIDFKHKVKIFNSHFSKQCSLINKNSKFPPDYPQKSNESLSSITFEINDIDKIINHGYDMLSICMLKLYGESIYQSLDLLFRFV